MKTVSLSFDSIFFQASLGIIIAVACDVKQQNNKHCWTNEDMRVLSMQTGIPIK